MQAGNLVTKKRTRIASENVRYVLCLRSWGLLPLGENGDNNTEEEDDSPLVDDEGKSDTEARARSSASIELRTGLEDAANSRASLPDRSQR